MGTNYYVMLENKWHATDDQLLKDLHPKFNKVHIGKSSGGWVFTLRLPYISDFDGTKYECTWDDNQENATPEIESLKDWLEFLDGKRILDEYYREIPLHELTAIITEREGMLTDDQRDEALGQRGFRDAVAGPNGLFRHKLDGTFCVGYGDGTWDYVRGEFI